MQIEGKKILVLVTGSIAAYKSALLVRELIKKGAQVKVGMTQAAQKFITSYTFSVLTKEEVLVDIFDSDLGEVKHIDWAQWPDLILVAPATANTMAKAAHGLADDTVSTVLLASNATKIFVPAMNDIMWNNPANQKNIETLKDYQALVMEPEEGFLAEGYSAKGRFRDIEDIIDYIETSVVFKKTNLYGKKVLITAGPGQEMIDPVRYIGNKSSGKMGHALAKAAKSLGADVTLLTSSDLKVPKTIKTKRYSSAQQLFDLVQKEFVDCDVYISAAAVSDFRVEKIADQKIKKAHKDDVPELKLVQNPDILEYVGKNKSKNQKVIGFAAETEDLIKNSKKKILKKNADLIITNDVSRSDIGFSSDENETVLVYPYDKHVYLTKDKKENIAMKILLEIDKMLTNEE